MSPRFSLHEAPTPTASLGAELGYQPRSLTYKPHPRLLYSPKAGPWRALRYPDPAPSPGSGEDPQLVFHLEKQHSCSGGWWGGGGGACAEDPHLSPAAPRPQELPHFTTACQASLPLHWEDLVDEASVGLDSAAPDALRCPGAPGDNLGSQVFPGPFWVPGRAEGTFRAWKTEGRALVSPALSPSSGLRRGGV